MRKAFSVAMLLAASSASTFAATSERANIRLSEPLRVNSIEIPAGEYRVTWSGQGPNIQIQFLHSGKIVVTARANVVAAHNETTIGWQESPFQLVTIQRNASTFLKEIQLPK